MRMLNAMRRGSEREIARPDGELALLTHREHEIYLALANGTSTRVIADHLHLTEGTVRWHAARLMKKLRVTSRMDLADDRPHRDGHSKPDARLNPVRPLLRTAGYAGTAGSDHRTSRTPALLPSVDDDVARVEQLDQAARWASAAQSERRVARLVAQGMTNRAVAEVLYVSSTRSTRI